MSGFKRVKQVPTVTMPLLQDALRTAYKTFRALALGHHTNGGDRGHAHTAVMPTWLAYVASTSPLVKAARVQLYSI